MSSSKKQNSFCSLPALAMVVFSMAVSAQPTGNPKGTAAPASQEMVKSPASGSTAAAANGTGSTGKLDSGPASARLAPSRAPGTGTAGGLPKRNVGDGPAAPVPSTDSTSVPVRQPTPPAR